MVIPAYDNLAKASSDDADTAFSFLPAQLNLTGPEVTTDVVAFTVYGRTRQLRIEIQDLDILFTADNQRLVPILRLLRVLQAEGTFANDTISFSLFPGVTRQLNLATNMLQVGQEQYPLRIKTGISDLTGQGEIYVSETILSRGFDLEYEWDDMAYAYELHTKNDLRVFLAMERSMTRMDVDITKIASHLPETEPVKYPLDSRQVVSFVDAGVRVDNRRIKQPDSQTAVKPDVSFYGQLFGGNYQLRLSETMTSDDSEVPKGELWIEKGIWVSKSENHALRMGDTSQGLSSLVVPSASFTGVVSRGIVGRGSQRNKKRFLDNSRFSFLSETSLDGFVPIGSRVELYVNNRLVDSIIAEDTKDAPPGQAKYDFIGVGLFGRAINEVKVVVTQPDGSVEEDEQTIVGSTSLLPAGQLAYSASVGTKRREVEEELVTEGRFGGLGVYYGLNRYVTLGLLAAAQQNFFYRYDDTASKMPRSYFLGQSLSIQPYSRLLFNGEIAQNNIPGQSTQPRAIDLSIQYWFDRMLLAAYQFRYDKNYINGSIDIDDREGRAYFAELYLTPYARLRNTYASIYSIDNTARENYFASNLKTLTPIPRTQLDLRLDQLESTEELLSTRQMYSAGLKSDYFKRVMLKAEYGWGDSIRSVSSDDLRYGVAVPMLGSILSYGSRLEARYQLQPSSYIGGGYRDTKQGSRSVELYFSRAKRRKYRIDSTLKARYDLERENVYADVSLELPLDTKRQNFIGAGVNYNDIEQEYRFNIFMSFRELFYPRRGRLSRLNSESRISPETGGLKGMVYLDVNANGHYEDGEPGVPEIEVFVDGRRKYVSDDNGYFFVGRSELKEQVMVALNDKDLAAFYTPTQGRQKAMWEEYTFTSVNLGVSTLNSVSGRVAIWQGDKKDRNLPGAIVLLKRKGDQQIVKQSITDDTGAYYLGELKPGQYILELDSSSIPPNIQNPRQTQQIELAADLDTLDIEGIDFRLLKQDRGS